ncbi:MAG: galactose-1-phosphate uridylyltransferase [Candidatus Geothermincolia bacterium]
MAELRWNPILRTWVIMSSHRQNRPLLNPDIRCPFCPGSGKVPEEFDIFAYPNDFPSLDLEPPVPDVEGDDLIPVRPAFGHCEVTLYSPKHDVTLPELPLEHIDKLVEHWTERYRALGDIEGIEYVFIFENRGEAVGVTMHHPHGQIYAYSFLPLKPKVELASAAEHWAATGKCLFCDLLDHEVRDGSRVVYRVDGYCVFVPPFAEFPYQVYIVPESHIGSMTSMTREQRNGLAKAIKCVTGAYDSLFGVPFPYMMCMHQDPTDGGQYPYNHFHIEFYPPLRDREKLKFNASSETGAWATINDTRPEEKAAELRVKIDEQLALLEG